MNSEAILAVFEKLDSMNDEEIAGMAFAERRLVIPTVAMVTNRYVGKKRIPGPPMGLTQRPDGTYRLGNIAIVRVHTDEYLGAALGVVEKGLLKALLISAGCAVAACVLTALAWGFLHNRNHVSPVTYLSPCQLTRITDDSVFCRQGDHEAGVALNQNFPNGQYRLTAIASGQTGFAATHIQDQRSVAFQVDPKFTSPPRR